MKKASVLMWLVLVIVIVAVIYFFQPSGQQDTQQGDQEETQQGGQEVPEDEPKPCTPAQCSNQLWCDGIEICDGINCQDGPDPCNLADPCISGCNEAKDECHCDVTDNLDPCCCKTVCVECDFCEGDFDIDKDVDASDLQLFLADFGRGRFNRPCTNQDPCNGDFCCDGDVDSLDLPIMAADFGRNPYHPTDPCPMGSRVPWCDY